MKNETFNKLKNLIINKCNKMSSKKLPCRNTMIGEIHLNLTKVLDGTKYETGSSVKLGKVEYHFSITGEFTAQRHDDKTEIALTELYYYEEKVKGSYDSIEVELTKNQRYEINKSLN